ncbi:YMGG-like Gly-zipper domain-containing protein [Halomonas sp. NYA30]
MTRCPYCGATPLSPPSLQARHRASQTGAQIGATLGAVKGRTGMAIGSLAGAVIGGLLAAQRWWPVADGYCHACHQPIPREPEASNAKG